MEQPNDEEIKDDSEQETLDFSKPSFKFEQSNCDWRQLGPYIFCKSCEIQHGRWIGPDKILVGLNEKGPMFKDRKDYEK